MLLLIAVIAVLVHHDIFLDTVISYHERCHGCPVVSHGKKQNIPTNLVSSHNLINNQLFKVHFLLLEICANSKFYDDYYLFPGPKLLLLSHHIINYLWKWKQLE